MEVVFIPQNTFTFTIPWCLLNHASHLFLNDRLFRHRQHHIHPHHRKLPRVKGGDLVVVGGCTGAAIELIPNFIIKFGKLTEF